MDGQTEGLNKCLEMYLRCFTTGTPQNWVAMLPWAESLEGPDSDETCCGQIPSRLNL